MHKGKNNKGLTLVELIVAVAILAIIVLPLLKAFVISAGTNAKAKEKLRTTELAQNIMEGLEAADLSNLTYQFCNPGTDNCDFTLLTGQKMTVSQMDTDTDGVYCFAMKDLTASEKKYDALITISANQETAENGTVNNADDVVNISRIDAGHDALSVPSKTTNDIMTAIGTQYADVQQSEISRTITVLIETVSGASDPYQRVTVSYQYNWKKNGTDYVFPSGVSSNLYSDVIFENAGAAEERALSNVYLFFYPWYTSTQGNLSDTIVISNTSDQDVTVYLVKQESNAANLDTLETGYRVTVNVKEPYVSASDTGTNTGVRTNLDTNLATGKTADQVIWSLNDEIADAAKKITRNALSAKEAQDRLYDVTVSIYPSGAYDSKFMDFDAITTLTGGMLN